MFSLEFTWTQCSAQARFVCKQPALVLGVGDLLGVFSPPGCLWRPLVAADSLLGGFLQGATTLHLLWDLVNTLCFPEPQFPHLD